jgi:hypothetical protein
MMRARQHIICVWGIFSIGNKSWQIPSGIVKSLTGLSAQLAVAVSNCKLLSILLIRALVLNVGYSIM